MTLADKLAHSLGANGWITEGTDHFHKDWLGYHAHPPLGVARPKTTDQVATVVQLARQARIPITPQGGNTSLCAGAVPAKSGEIILSLSRMTAIESIDTVGGSVTVQAGVVLANLHEAVESKGLIFPMHLGAEGSAQIGGLISTNAGGNHVLRYGMMQDLVFGLEVVLPNATVWNGLRHLQKDNAGYQLRKLFCGAEGTLGIITRAALKLYPMPKQRATALVCIRDFQTCVELGAALKREYHEFISSLEFFSDLGLEFVLRNIHDTKFPCQSRTPAYVLIELSTSSPQVQLHEMLESFLFQMFEKDWIVDGTVAANESQRMAFWRLRDEMPMGQAMEGAQIKHDISVPTARLADFIEQMIPSLEKILVGVRINAFGHLGDGNIHLNLTVPAGQQDFAGQQIKLSEEIYQRAEQEGGSFAAEHGLGRIKIPNANKLRSSVERQLMSSLKLALDPFNLMNPGVIVDDRGHQDLI